MENRTYCIVKDLASDSLSLTCGKPQKAQERYGIWQCGVIDTEVAGLMPNHFTFTQWLSCYTPVALSQAV